METILLKTIFLLFLCFFITKGDVRPSDCNKYFHNGLFPIPKHYRNDNDLVKLCQNEETAAGVKKDAVFATLFNTANRIPVYSANKIKITDSHNKQRPNGRELWKREASGICGRHGKGPLLSKIKKLEVQKMYKCEEEQAGNRDYVDNGLELTRGHLEPSNTNNDNEYKQKTTFTLTNAAPQYKTFNEGSWERIECLIRELIYYNGQQRSVYVVTGVSGWAKDGNDRNIKLKNRVRVPGKFWKAVCFPGDEQAVAWSFVIKIKNEKKFGPQNKEALFAKMGNLKTYMKELFNEGQSPFGDACLNATPQPAKQQLENHWDSYYKNKCRMS